MQRLRRNRLKVRGHKGPQPIEQGRPGEFGAEGSLEGGAPGGWPASDPNVS